MGYSNADVVVCLIVFTSACTLYVVNKLLSSYNVVNEADQSLNWIREIIINITGYSTVFLPGFLVYRYIRKINYFSKCSNKSFLNRLVWICFGEDELITPTAISTAANKLPSRTQFQNATLLLFYFFGLQVSYLSWGLLQEKVMTQKYINSTGKIGYFKDSQFLVFVNRILAFIMSGIVLLCKRQSRHKCPLYKYAFCSFSNILSSWCQYEALKFVSFPNQVLAKTAKTIPVMIMGKVLFKTKYEFYEYVTAIILSLGMLLFMLNTETEKSVSTATTFIGFSLLCCYIVFDSFTSNWQGALFKQYSMKPVQMMCFVNFFSSILTAISMFQRQSFINSIEFILEYPQFFLDCILLSIFSASGQLFIYSTIAAFGPLVFAIITTIRQGLSVLLSCIVYHHHVNGIGVIGLFLVFFSILLRIYCSHRLKAIKKSQSDMKNQRTLKNCINA